MFHWTTYPRRFTAVRAPATTATETKPTVTGRGTTTTTAINDINNTIDDRHPPTLTSSTTKTTTIPTPTSIPTTSAPLSSSSSSSTTLSFQQPSLSSSSPPSFSALSDTTITTTTNNNNNNTLLSSSSPVASPTSTSTTPSTTPLSTSSSFFPSPPVLTSSFFFRPRDRRRFHATTPPRIWSFPSSSDHTTMPFEPPRRRPFLLSSSSSPGTKVTSPSSLCWWWPSARMATSLLVAALFICMLTFVSVSRMNGPLSKSLVWQSSSAGTFVTTTEGGMITSGTGLQRNEQQQVERQQQETGSERPVSVSVSVNAVNRESVGDGDNAVKNIGDDAKEEEQGGLTVSHVGLHNEKILTSSDHTSGLKSIEQRMIDTNIHTTTTTSSATDKSPTNTMKLSSTTSDPKEVSSILSNDIHTLKTNMTLSSSLSSNPLTTSPTSDDASDLDTFSNLTTLVYFHLHKTGGVSFKQRLYTYFYAPNRFKHDRATRVSIFDTCHLASSPQADLGREARWACDWSEMRGMSAAQRQKTDVIIGHQYWERGAKYYMGDTTRKLRYFTVLRHPLHRKISFFFHFFVRNVGRSEKSVSYSELRDFILDRNMKISSSSKNENDNNMHAKVYNMLHTSALMRDAGPAYYASRLESDGIHGFNKRHRYYYHNNTIVDTNKAAIIKAVKHRLSTNFVFIGLQAQEAASLCMLQHTVDALSSQLGVRNRTGIEDIGKVSTLGVRKRLNVGDYPINAKQVWSGMTEEERREYEDVEMIDLKIYEEGVALFRKAAHKLGCAHLVEHKDDEYMGMTA